MPSTPDNNQPKGGLPKIKVHIKPQPSSGGFANWVPIFQWATDGLKHLFHRSH
ncbi:hypothetical protein [Secundilactobacillus paracollinoides]|uniref:hypothetical protein n=1 Tax=Secundilactobacillus paracollinoides TaxID=240427 RepID=UPI0012EA83A6|nr:hypothetical protein [Secundilactobacillus paracollinoides]